jgi:hypothetical protein
MKNVWIDRHQERLLKTRLGFEIRGLYNLCITGKFSGSALDLVQLFLGEAQKVKRHLSKQDRVWILGWVEVCLQMKTQIDMGLRVTSDGVKANISWPGLVVSYRIQFDKGVDDALDELFRK